jgi:hypothetical protein
MALRDNIVVDSRKAFQHHQAILSRFVRRTEHRECDVSDLLSPGQNQTTAFSGFAVMSIVILGQPRLMDQIFIFLLYVAAHRYLILSCRWDDCPCVMR